LLFERFILIGNFENVDQRYKVEVVVMKIAIRVHPLPGGASLRNLMQKEIGVPACR
jgi:hypothetical protein